jgi:hypothetical protein
VAMSKKIDPAYLEMIKNSPVNMGIWSGFTDLKDIHNQWIKKFLFSKKDETTLAHRGSYKTTCLSIAMAILIIIKPDANMVFLRKSDTDVIEIILQVQKLLRNDYFQRLAYELYGKRLELIKASSYEIDTNLKTNTKGASQLVGLGIKTSITGKHADIVITDDIVNIKDRISKAERDYIKMQYQELQNIKNRGGRIINTGTPWHKDDAISTMPNVERYDVNSTGLISKAQQNALRDSMTASLYAANYELKHIADADAMFTNVRIDDGTNSDKIYNGVCHIDASYGGSDGTAFTVLKEHSDGFIYVYGELHQRHVDDVLEGLEAKRKHYKAGTLYNERNADKGYLNKKIADPKKCYHENMNKYVKISTHLKGQWSRIIFLSETDSEYINQILDYTENATHDDAPDSLASLLRETVTKKAKWGIGGMF